MNTKKGIDMNATTLPRLAYRVVSKPVAWSLATLALLATGLISASLPLLLVCGVLAFGRPLLHAALLETEAGQPTPARDKRRLPFEERASRRAHGADSA